MRSGQLAHLTGVSTDTLRHYERLGLLPLPQRSAGNYRDYSPQSQQRVGLIQRALTIGFSLSELKTILAVRDRGGAPCRGSHHDLTNGRNPCVFRSDGVFGMHRWPLRSALCARLYLYCRPLSRNTLPLTVGHLHPCIGPALMDVHRLSRRICALAFEAARRDGRIAK